MPYTIEQVRNSLPAIGDRRHGGTVDYVNTRNLWYRVRFADGTDESFKLPKYDTSTQIIAERKINPEPKKMPRSRSGSVKCKVLETGKTYNSYAECGADIGCSAPSVRTAARRRKKCMRKYTIVDLEY